MRDVGPRLPQTRRDRIQHPLHRFLAVQHTPGLLIALNVVFDLSLELIVDLLVLNDLPQEGVYVSVQQCVLGIE